MSIRNKIITAILSLSLVAVMVPSGVVQAALTSAQVDAIISLLQSFGADATTIANVQASLTGGTPTPPGTGNYQGIPAGFTFTTNIPVGTVSQDVVYLKAVLIGEGCGNGITNTTYYGPHTQANVQCFQNKYKTQISAFAGYTIASTGLVGTGTRAQLNALLSGTTPPPTVPTGAGLTVALAAGNPASGTIVAGQAVAPLAKLTFTNGDNAEVKVTSLNLKRTGISADASLANVYLFDGATRLTDGAAVSSTVLNFNLSSGIFTVPAGGSKTITVAADICTTTACTTISGQTVAVSVLAASDITTNASSVKGTFPVQGNLFTVATGTLAGAEFNATTTPAASSVDPQDDYTMWQNTVTVTTRAIDMTRISLRKTGSVKNTDLQNFRLYVDGVQVGSAVANLDANGYVTFDLTSAPKRLEAGSRVIKVLGNIVGGSSLTFTFNLWSSADVTLIDSQYLANTLPDLLSDAAFSKRSTGEQTVNSGVITITKTTDSPSGNIVNAASNATLAKFQIKAAGEAIKIETLKASVVVNTIAVGYLRNGMLLANGVQVGSTSNLYDTTNTSPYYTSFSLGSSLIVEPGSPVTLEVRADIYDNDGTNDITATGTASTIQVTIEGSSSENNAEGRVSAATIDAPASDVTGNALTVAAGGLTLSLDTGYAAHSVVAPLTAYKLADFNLVANTTEAVNITAINVILDEVSGYMSNLYVKYGTQTTSVKPSITSATNSWSINYTLASGTTIPIEIYSDVSSLMTTGTGTLTLDVDGTTVSSAATADSASTTTGQALTYRSGAFAAAFASTPQSQTVSGTQQIEAARFKFTASYQAYTIQEVKIDPDVYAVNGASLNAENVISSAVLKDGSTVLATQSFNAVDTLGSTGGFYFTGLSVAVPASTSKTITVDFVLATPSATNKTSGLMIIPALTYVKYMDPQGAVLTITDTGNTYKGNSTYVYKAVPTITKVALSGTTITNGSAQDLFKFTVAAPSQGDINIKQFKVDLAWSDGEGGTDALELNAIKLFKDGVDITTSVTTVDEDYGLDVEGSTLLTGVTEGNSKIIFTWSGSTEDVIGAGSSTTYTIRATPQGFNILDQAVYAASDTVSLSFNTDATDAAFGVGSGDSDNWIGFISIGTTLTNILKIAVADGTSGSEAANLIWSDDSAVAHSAATSGGTGDWANSYLLKDSLTPQTWTH